MPREEEPMVERSDPDERSLAQLLKLSGERWMPGAHATQRAQAAALEAWESRLQEERFQKRRKLLFGFAAALSLLTIGALAWRTASDQALPSMIDARIATVWGSASLVDRSGRSSFLATDGAPIAIGTQLQTRDGRVAMTFSDSLSLRVNVNTRLRFDSEEQVTLVAGTIYVDSGGLSTGSNLRIVTPAGEVQHQGTQYLISVGADATRIIVREGRVQLQGQQQQTQIAAGELIDIDAAGRVSRSAAPAFGASWEWASTLAPAIDLDNRPLTEFLSWMVREHGWQLRYASPSDEAAAQSIRLHGSAQGATPLDTLHRVSLITGLDIDVEHGALIVGTRNE